MASHDFHPPQFDSMIQLQYDIFADKGPKLRTDLPGWKISLLLHHNSRFCLFLLKAIGRSGCDWRVCSNNLRVGLSLSNLEPIWIDDLQLQRHVCCWFKVQHMHKYFKEVKRQLLFTYASDHTTYDMFNRVFWKGYRISSSNDSL